MGEGNRDAKHPFPAPQIQVIQGAGLDLDQYFMRGDGRFWGIFVPEDLWSSVLMKSNGFHGAVSLILKAPPDIRHTQERIGISFTLVDPIVAA
jgi:hypothetical protein